MLIHEVGRFRLKDIMSSFPIGDKRDFTIRFFVGKWELYQIP
jgi:hypothetical protein